MSLPAYASLLFCGLIVCKQLSTLDVIFVYVAVCITADSYL